MALQQLNVLIEPELHALLKENARLGGASLATYVRGVLAEGLGFTIPDSPEERLRQAERELSERIAGIEDGLESLDRRLERIESLAER